MDQRIYGRLNRTDLGNYGTRRFPKGGPTPNISPVAAADPLNRNPLVIARNYRVANQVAGGGTVDVARWNYTVPLRRRAVFQSLEVELVRSLAGAGNTMSYASIYLRRANTIQAGGSSLFEVIRVSSHNDVVGSSERMVHTGILELYEGDYLEGATSLVNGNMSFVVTAQGIEYDAEERITGQDVSRLADDAPGGAGSRGSGYSAFTGFRYPTVSSGPARVATPRVMLGTDLTAPQGGTKGGFA